MKNKNNSIYMYLTIGSAASYFTMLITSYCVNIIVFRLIMFVNIIVFAILAYMYYRIDKTTTN
jgi:hypothetical protein